MWWEECSVVGGIRCVVGGVWERWRSVVGGVRCVKGGVGVSLGEVVCGWAGEQCRAVYIGLPSP